ncbi:heparan-alpha-glucosaminide N-acetyltransferase domain-containing protein [Kineococcus sp. GCM10028916]|uniref:heparan-alpha-glucosaminide N-acetyltransferase domain-containing protein n=1 Tax=Kineococcus sp. GCM10028916 TaxID=3273394 RepID=UPI00364332F8
MGSARIVGVDLARAIAIVGMMAIHVFPGEETPGAGGVLYTVAHGRASALFGVLAGLSLGLSTRGRGDRRAAARTSVVVRGVLVALLGLLLVDAGSRIAIILPYYGVAFVVVLPFLWWPARRLAVLAGGWLVLAPVASFALRAVYELPARYEQPTLGWLSRPGDLLETLTLTGYYPVIGWAGYLLLGLAVSKLDLRSTVVGTRLLGAGALTAGGSWIASALLLGPLGGRTALSQVQDFYGTVPTDTRWWLAIAAPHSGTPFDLLHTAGTALTVVGALCLLPAAVTRFLQPVAAFGAMPLTIYTAHVIALAAWPAETTTVLVVHVFVGVVSATGWRLAVGRGPLEIVVGRAASGAAALVRSPRLPWTA